MFKPFFRFLFLFCVISFVCCSSKDDRFVVAKNKVGYLNSSTKVDEIFSIFKNDSVVKRLSEGILGYNGSYFEGDDKYLVYSKEGKHLLTITPKEPLDSLSTIEFIDIHDPIYKTKDGLCLDSTFEEINLLTRIGKVEGTFTRAILYLEDLNATMTLDKRDLGMTSIKTESVELEQIPNLVKPKTFVVWFD